MLNKLFFRHFEFLLIGNTFIIGFSLVEYILNKYIITILRVLFMFKSFSDQTILNAL